MTEKTPRKEFCRLSSGTRGAKTGRGEWKFPLPVYVKCKKWVEKKVKSMYNIIILRKDGEWNGNQEAVLCRRRGTKAGKEQENGTFF